MATDEKRESLASKLVIPLIIAIVAGGSSPWWWDKAFGNNPRSANGGNHYPANMGPLELHINRQGSDFSPNPEHAESPETCARLCADSPSCKAMTYVNSPNNLPGGDCWLKTDKPPKTPRADMTSAEKSGA